MYLQLFEYADVILSCNLSSQVLQHGEEYDIFCVLDNIRVSSLMAYFELNIALLSQRTRNNFILALMARDNDTIRATPRYRPCKKIHFWIRLAERVRGGTTL